MYKGSGFYIVAQRMNAGLGSATYNQTARRMRAK